MKGNQWSTAHQDDHTPLSELTPDELLEVCGPSWRELMASEPEGATELEAKFGHHRVRAA